MLMSTDRGVGVAYVCDPSNSPSYVLQYKIPKTLQYHSMLTLSSQIKMLNTMQSSWEELKHG